MIRIYSDKPIKSIFIYVIILFLFCPVFAQSLSSKPELKTDQKVTDQEMQLMQQFASDSSSESGLKSADRQERKQYTPPSGTDKLDNIAQKESQTISKKSDTTSIGSSDSISGADNSKGSNSDGNKTTSRKTPGIWQPLFSLLGVITVIVVMAWLIKRFFPSQVNSGVGDVIQVIGRVSIDNRNTLCLAKFGNEIVLLGVGINGVNLIDKVSDPDKIASLLGKIEAARVSSISKSFSNVFKNARGDYLDDNLEDEEIIEEYDDEGSVESRKDDELAGLLNKVKGLSKLKQNKRDH